MNAVRATLYYGDCLKEMAHIPDRSVDLVLTDTPYGTTNCSWDSIIPLNAMWANLRRVTKPKGTIVLFGSQPFSSALIMSNPTWFKYEWVWEKPKATGHLNAKKRPLNAHENILVFYQKYVYYPQMAKGTGYKGRKNCVSKKEHYGTHGSLRSDNEGTRYPRTVLRFNHVQSPFHPSQKPVDLLEYLIRTYTLEGDTVLDFTFGSCSTGVACINTNRQFIGIEQDGTYFNHGVQRLLGTLQ